MAKVVFNNKVEDVVKELFETLHSNLGGHKFRIIEAAIEVFAALPKEHQRALVSQDDDDRRAILAKLNELNLKSAKGKRA